MQKVNHIDLKFTYSVNNKIIIMYSIKRGKKSEVHSFNSGIRWTNKNIEALNDVFINYLILQDIEKISSAQGDTQ